MTEEEKQKQGSNTVLGLRVFQIFSLCIVIVGFIWSSGDYITSIFPDSSVVNPASVLMMLYGTLGTLGSEGIIRYLTRKK